MLTSSSPGVKNWLRQARPQVYAVRVVRVDGARRARLDPVRRAWYAARRQARFARRFGLA